MSDSLHILMVTRSLPLHRLGGMEMVTWDLARQFVRDGHRVTVLTTELPDKPQTFSEEGVSIVALKGTRSGSYSRAWWRLSKEYFEKHFSRHASEGWHPSQQKVSLVLSVSAGAYGLLASRKTKSIPFFLQAHGTSWGELISKWRTLSPKAILSSVRNFYALFKDLYYYTKFDKVIAIGPAVEQQLKSFPVSLVLSDDKVRLINNGVDTNCFYPDQKSRVVTREELGINDTATVILSASRLHRQKGVHLGLQAFALYLKQQPDARYVVIGEGPERESLEKLTKNLGIASKVKFLGKKPREALNSYYAMADVFLFTTTRVEGLPLNILEALAAGVAVVCSGHLGALLKTNEGIHPVNYADNEGIARTLFWVTQKKTDKLKVKLPLDMSLSQCAQNYSCLFKI